MIFGGVWLSDDGASDACRARLRLRRWQFGGDLDVVMVHPELSSAPNLPNLEVDGDLFAEDFATSLQISSLLLLAYHAAGSRHCFSPTVFNLPFAIKTGFLFHLFTSLGTID